MESNANAVVDSPGNEVMEAYYQAMDEIRHENEADGERDDYGGCEADDTGDGSGDDTGDGKGDDSGDSEGDTGDDEGQLSAEENERGNPLFLPP